MLTAAGCLLGESSSTNGTKKFPHAWMKTKMKTTPSPGRISGTTIRRRAVMALAPSTQAASSRLIGTESMKFLVIQIAIGRDVAAMKKIVAGIESIRLSRTNRLYTGTMIAVIGRQVPNRMAYMNGL